VAKACGAGVRKAEKRYTRTALNRDLILEF
jgi:hypothetical protein